MNALIRPEGKRTKNRRRRRNGEATFTEQNAGTASQVGMEPEGSILSIGNLFESELRLIFEFGVTTDQIVVNLSLEIVSLVEAVKRRAKKNL